jgi:triphosphoribosyl-dephospho-CoA synthase
MFIEGKKCNIDQAVSIASLAVQAILYEASCNPSPGLVSKVSNGAHRIWIISPFLDRAPQFLLTL